MRRFGNSFRKWVQRIERIIIIRVLGRECLEARVHPVNRNRTAYKRVLRAVSKKNRTV